MGNNRTTAPLTVNMGNCVSCDQWLEMLDELNIGAFTVNVDRRVATINLSAQALINQKRLMVILPCSITPIPAWLFSMFKFPC